MSKDKDSISKDINKAKILLQSSFDSLMSLYSHLPDTAAETSQGQALSEALDRLEIINGSLQDVTTMLEEI